MNEQIEQDRQHILKKFLKAAAFDGWNNNVLMKIECKESPLLFFDGIEELTEYFHKSLNKNMEEQFNTIKGEKIHEKIIRMIEIKFSLYQSHKEAIRALMKYNLRPLSILSAKSRLWDTCSRIWYLAGDKSTDYNYYTKRTLLAGVYSSSLVYWLNDESEDHCNTKVFIRNRIKNILTFSKWKDSSIRFLTHSLRPNSK